jgi:hypothetical protein
MENSTTDWLQVIIAGVNCVVAMVGIYYVAQTLRQQAKVSEDQAAISNAQFDLLKIESDRAAREIKPEVDIINISRKGDIVQFSNIIATYKILCEKNTAFRVCFEYLAIGADVAKLSSNMRMAKVISHKLKQGHFVEFTITEAQFAGTGGITIRVHFLDAADNAFYEDFNCEAGVVTYGSRFPLPPPTMGVNGNLFSNNLNESTYF